MITFALWGCSEPIPTDTATPVQVETGHTGIEDATDPWIQVTNAPCGLTASGRLECWESAGWPVAGSLVEWAYLPIPEVTTRFTRVWAASSAVVWGVDVDGRTVLVRCTSVAGELAIWCDVPPPEAYRFTQVARSAGLTDDGRLIDWDDGEQPIHWYPTDRAYVLLSPSHGNLALDEYNELHYGANYFRRPARVHAFPPERQIIELSPWDIVYACALDADGIVECFDLDGSLPVQPFQNGPYQRLRGDLQGTCAQRADHVIECNNGQTHDFGPLRDFAVTVNDTGWSLPVSSPDLPIDLCALTEAGAIHCVGPRYLPDLVAKLPTGDPLLEP